MKYLEIASLASAIAFLGYAAYRLRQLGKLIKRLDAEVDALEAQRLEELQWRDINVLNFKGGPPSDGAA